MNKKGCWLYLDAYVHVVVKSDSVLLYNTLNSEAVEYKNNLVISNLVKKLAGKKKLFAVKLSEEDLCDKNIKKFVHDIMKHYMGDLIDAGISAGKPIQLMPMLNIQKDVRKIKRQSESSVGKDLMSYLSEVSLFINNECGQKCCFCENAYKQFLFCSGKKGRGSELSLDAIKKLIGETEGSSLWKINVLGGNLFDHSEINNLIQFLNEKIQKKEYYMHYKNVEQHSDKIKLIDKKTSQINLMINCPVDVGELSSALNSIRKMGLDVNCGLIIEKEKDMDLFEGIISEQNIEEYTLKPYFNGKNLKFFKDNVFVNKSEIFESKLNMDELMSRQAMNELHFGKITVLSNGNVHANVNEPRLGVLDKDSLYDILFKEMDQGKSWRRLRMKASPCKNCILNNLCPPLSNYEYALKRNNLCHVLKG